MDFKALIPNIYPIALTLSENARANEKGPLRLDLKKYDRSNEIFLTVNARYLCQNSNKYACRCEAFIQNEHDLLFPKTDKKCVRSLMATYSHLTQTEFHEILMWGRSLFNTMTQSGVCHLSERIVEIDALIKILSNKIESD